MILIGYLTIFIQISMQAWIDELILVNLSILR